MFSTEASGFAFRTVLTTLSDCFLLKPKTSKADNASSLFVLLAETETSSILNVFKTI